MNRLKGTLYDGTTRLRRAGGEPLWMYSMAGLAEYCVVPATGLFALPDGLPARGVRRLRLFDPDRVRRRAPRRRRARR